MITLSTKIGKKSYHVLFFSLLIRLSFSFHSIPPFRRPSLYVDSYKHNQKTHNKIQTKHLVGKIEANTLFGGESSGDAYDISLFSPCKINLFLRIIRKRPDGFHDLASLFQAVGFGDTLQLKLLDNDQDVKEDIFDCNMEGVPKDKSNLVLRALNLIREKTGNTDKFFKANLIKQVPAQAGLGGGSANAATAMFGANELLKRPATEEQLIDWSKELGSDITFFLSRGTAYCTGRGEILSSITPPLPAGQKVTIVKPSVGLSTPAVFKALQYDKLSTLDPLILLKQFTETGGNNADVSKVNEESFVNDLELPAFSVVPELKELKEDLEECGFDRVLMSGSGTSIFCLGDAKDLDIFSKKIEGRKDLNVFQTTFINRKEGDGVWYCT